MAIHADSFHGRYSTSAERMVRQASRFSSNDMPALAGLVENPEAFSLHSGRRGGATEAISNGCDLLSLKRQGRWRSDSCPQIYVDDVLNCSSRFTSFLRF